MSQVNRSTAIRWWVFKFAAIVFAGLSVVFVFGASKSMIHGPEIWIAPTGGAVAGVFSLLVASWCDRRARQLKQQVASGSWEK